MRTRCQPRYIGIVLAAVIVVLSLRGLVTTVAASPSVSVGALVLIPELMLLVPLVAGILLIGFGWPQRAGSTLHCRSCGYANRPGRIAPLCPECGAAWRWYGGQVRGTPVRHPGRVWLGAPLLVAGLALHVWQFAAPTGFMLSVPTPVLMGRATALPGPELKLVLDEFERRTISTRERNTMVAGLLDRRLRDARVPLVAETWMFAQASNGVLDPTLEERVYVELLDLTLVTKADWSRGPAFETALDGLYRGPRSGPGAWVIVESLSIVDSSGDDAPISTTSLGGVRHASALGQIRPIGVRVNGPVTGPAEVRVGCWVLVGPPGAYVQGVTRFADGSVYVPTGVPWARRVELVASVPASVIESAPRTVVRAPEPGQYQLVARTTRPKPTAPKPLATTDAASASSSRLSGVGADAAPVAEVTPGAPRSIARSRQALGAPLASVVRSAPIASYERGYGVGTRPIGLVGPADRLSRPTWARSFEPWSVATPSRSITTPRSLFGVRAPARRSSLGASLGSSGFTPGATRIDHQIDLRAPARRP